MTTDAEDKQTVSAREIYRTLEIEQRFSAWFKTNAQGYVEGEDYTSVVAHTLVNNGASREITDYNMTIEMAKHICMMSRTEKGYQCRQKLIELEKAWNNPEVIFYRALKMAEKTIDGLKRQNNTLLSDIDRMKPKELFADAVTGSENSILVRELAKLLNQNGIDTGEQRLFAWLRENGYLIRQKGADYNAPTQKGMDLKLFEVKEKVVVKKDGSKMTVRTTYVTGKGQQYFINKFLAGQQLKPVRATPTAATPETAQGEYV